MARTKDDDEYDEDYVLTLNRYEFEVVVDPPSSV
jgi:hypothetical protein